MAAANVCPTVSSISSSVNRDMPPLLPTLGYYLTFIHYFGFSINPNDVRSRHLSIKVKRGQNQSTARGGGNKSAWLSNHQVGTGFRGGGDRSSRTARRKLKKCLLQTLRTSVKLAAISFTTFLTLNHCVVLVDYIFQGSKAFLELMLEVRLVTTKFSALIFVLSWHKNQAKVRQILKLVKSTSVYILSTQGFYGQPTSCCQHQLEQQQLQKIGRRWPVAAVCDNCSGKYLTPTRADLRSVNDTSGQADSGQQQQEPRRSNREIGEPTGFESASLRIVTSRIDRRIVWWWLMCTCVTILHFSLSEAEINHSHHLWVWLDDYSLHQLNNQTTSNSTLMFLASFDNYIYTVHVYGTRLIGASIICIVCSMQRENIDSLRWHTLQLIQSSSVASSAIGNSSIARSRQLDLHGEVREKTQQVAKFSSNHANCNASRKQVTAVSGFRHAHQQQQLTTIETGKAYCRWPDDNDCRADSSRVRDNNTNSNAGIANIEASCSGVKSWQHVGAGCSCRFRAAFKRANAQLASVCAWAANILRLSAAFATTRTTMAAPTRTTTTAPASVTTANVNRELFFILGESDWLRVRENSRQLRPCGYLSASIWSAKRLLFGRASRAMLVVARQAVGFCTFKRLKRHTGWLVARIGRMQGARADTSTSTVSASTENKNDSSGEADIQTILSRPTNLAASEGSSCPERREQQRRAGLWMACCGRCWRVGTAAGGKEEPPETKETAQSCEGSIAESNLVVSFTTTSLLTDGNDDELTSRMPEPQPNSKAKCQSGSQSATAPTTSNLQKLSQQRRRNRRTQRDTPTPTCEAAAASLAEQQLASGGSTMMNGVAGVDTLGPTPSELAFGGRRAARGASSRNERQQLQSASVQLLAARAGPQVRVPNNESSNNNWPENTCDGHHDDGESRPKCGPRVATNHSDMVDSARLSPVAIGRNAAAIQQLLGPAESSIEWQLEKLASKYELVRTVNARIDSCFGPMLLIQFSFLFLMSCIDLVYFSICFNPNTKTKYIIISGMILLWWPYLLLYKFASDIGSSSRQLLISVRRLARLSLIERQAPNLQGQLQILQPNPAGATFDRQGWRQQQATQQQQLIAGRNALSSLGSRHVHHSDEPLEGKLVRRARAQLQLPLAPGHNEHAFLAGRYSIFGGHSTNAAIAGANQFGAWKASQNANLSANYQWLLPPLRNSYGPGNYHWCSPAHFVSCARRQTPLVAQTGGSGHAGLGNKLDHVFKATNLSLVGIMTVDKFFFLNFAKIVITASVMMIQFISN